MIKKGEAKESKDSPNKSDVIEIPIGKFIHSLRNNIYSTYAVTLTVFILLILIFGNVGGSGESVSSQEAGQKLVDFVNSQGQGEAVLKSIERQGSLYNAVVSYNGEDIPVLVTLDGEYLITDPIPLASAGSAPVDSGFGGAENQRYEVSEDDDAVLGSPDAPVTIIEFSDYQCPYCERFWSQTLPLIKEQYIDTGKVKLIYRDYPLDFHPMATPAAIASECVHELGGDSGYYKYHDKLFENQASLSIDNMKKWAKELGYNIDSCLDSNKYLDEVNSDMQDGSAVGVQGTPGFFINGVSVSGAQPFSVFQQIIEQELNG
ncbi:MAG: thioredoxin domain-containing protein [Nanoarchaeota archaeon]